MVKMLDPSYEDDIKEEVIATLDGQGLTTGQVVNGLLGAILTLCEGNVQLLDEAVDRLVEGS